MTVETKTYPAHFGEITLVKITNKSGASVTLSSLGAGIISVEVPDKDGRLENVCLSYLNPADYMADGPCMGKVPGRYANRIARGTFDLYGMTYFLPINNGPNHLHGGPEGFQNRIWDVETFSNGVRFSLYSLEGDAGYPANLAVAVEYRWSEDNTLSISLSADAEFDYTVVNLTNHAYWNLDGADSGSALGQQLKIKASAWLPTDETLIPTGEIEGVAGTPMDFTEFRPIIKDINVDFPALKYGKGYDNCWVLDREITEQDKPDGAQVWTEKAMVNDAVVLKAAGSGRELHVDTDQPGVQMYSGNWLDGSPENCSHRSYRDYEGIAIEAQGFPDAPNKPDFPSQVVGPDRPYRRNIIYRFVVS